jgi:hypothetical protein
MRGSTSIVASLIVATSVLSQGCAGGGDDGTSSGPVGYELWKGSIQNSYYALNMYGQRASKVTGKPFMVVKYDNITLEILDCQFGLSEVTQENVPSDFGVAPEPTLDASTIEHHSELGLVGPVVLPVGWSSKSSLTLPNGTPVEINSTALFSFETGHSPGGVGYNSQWSFSRTSDVMTGAVSNIDTTYYLGLDSDSNAFHLSKL